MTRLSLLLLALVPIGIPAHAANPEFRVELFSGHTVKALTLEASGQTLSVCSSKMDGACLVLPPQKQLVCLAGNPIHCRLGARERSFSFFAINSPSAFQITLTLAGEGSSSLRFVARNLRVASRNAGLQLITVLDLESYVAGVLAGEASVLHEPEARQAMAILARTWAVRWRGRHRGSGFDFCSLTHCQVFRPSQAPAVNLPDGVDPAARATAGRVLQYHGALADPYFTACCGGMTEAAANLWPDRANPYLTSIHDAYCLADSHASWKQTLSAEDLLQVFRESLHLPLAGPFSELSVVRRDSSGRAIALRVVAGTAWTVDANNFRYAVGHLLGWERIKSNRYTIERGEDAWVFTGHGLGHGVGLCQAGAEQMARLGYSASQILSTYFPGTEISSSDADPVVSSEHFELAYPSSQEPWVKQTLDTLEQWRKELGLHANVLPPRVQVQTWRSVGDFIQATGQPGWMAGSSDGHAIALQPLELLAKRHILNQTLRHELAHLVVHRVRAKDVPLWFEEGFVLYLTGERMEASSAAPMGATQLEEDISHPRSEAEMKAAYAQALYRVRRLAKQGGEAGLWDLLEHPSSLQSHPPNK